MTDIALHSRLPEQPPEAQDPAVQQVQYTTLDHVYHLINEGGHVFKEAMGLTGVVAGHFVKGVSYGIAKGIKTLFTRRTS